MRSTPRLSMMVTRAGRLSGMAATPRLTEVINISKTGWFFCNPRKNRMAQIIRARMPSTFPVWLRRLVRGVCGACSCESIPAIFPICVFIPVSVTQNSPFPVVIIVPENTILSWSPSERFSICSESEVFSMLPVSPVRADSFADRLCVRRSLPSAGTRQPVSR